MENMASPEFAPKFVVPDKQIVAVEHPMIVKNLNEGLKTFGRGQPLSQILGGEACQGCLPIFLRPGDPTGVPILSHNTPTTNVVLKITVPRRTGRKRKRGSDDPFLDDEEGGTSVLNQHKPLSQVNASNLKSHSRLDKPEVLRQMLEDNADSYKVEAAGYVEETHRYRGLPDFHYSSTHGPFMTKVRDTILTGELRNIKKFKLDPSQGPKVNIDLVPPPSFTDHTMPYNWGYHQNSTIQVSINETGERTLVNKAERSRLQTYYITHREEAIPLGPKEPPPDDDPILGPLLGEMRKVMDERPMWTRRAFYNRLGQRPGFYLIKGAIQYIGYQFRGGPWRDVIIKYGIDPRSDPKYRIYQTMFFKIVEPETPGTPWRDIRSEYTRRQGANLTDPNSHCFDGKTIATDGKVWQMCDIRDPLLRRVIDTAEVRTTCDTEVDGWYHNGTIAKIKGIMRTKISAIQIGRQMQDHEFDETLKVPDENPGKKGAFISLHLPDYRGTPQERKALEASGVQMTSTKRMKQHVLTRSSHAAKIQTTSGKPISYVDQALADGLRMIKPQKKVYRPRKSAIEKAKKVDAENNLPPGTSAMLARLSEGRQDPRIQQTMEGLQAQGGMDSLLDPTFDPVDEEETQEAKMRRWIDGGGDGDTGSDREDEIRANSEMPANADEDWTQISDLALRRRAQNRIAQRNYRRKQILLRKGKGPVGENVPDDGMPEDADISEQGEIGVDWASVVDQHKQSLALPSSNGEAFVEEDLGEDAPGEEYDAEYDEETERLYINGGNEEPVEYSDDDDDASEADFEGIQPILEDDNEEEALDGLDEDDNVDGYGEEIYETAESGNGNSGTASPFVPIRRR